MIRREVFKSAHQRRIESFMRKAGQAVPESVTIPDGATRLLRAKLILEEAFETVKALGVHVYCDGDSDVPLLFDDLGFEELPNCDLKEVVDGCCDISVVTMGTLSAFGLPDDPFLIEVDLSNLRKFGEGSYRREDGKWMKPPNWRPPAIERVLAEWGWRP